MALTALPVSLKPIQHYLKTAVEHDQRDPVVAYYCRLYAAQRAMEIDRKSHESKAFLMALMDLLEKTKTSIKDHEAMQNEIVAQAHVENYALKLFLYADNEDRASRFGKNVIKSFYTAGMLMDVLTTFGELSEDVEKNRKYAKWKAAYIHNCIKNGETPVPGPMGGEDEDMGAGGAVGGPIGFEQPGPSQPAPTSYNQPQPTSYNQPPPPSQHHPGPQAPSGLGPSQSYNPNLPSPQNQPHAPATTPVDASHNAHTRWQPPPNPSGVQLEPKDYQQAMKFCKFASSALQYEDSKTAIENLTKALNLLTTGKP